MRYLLPFLFFGIHSVQAQPVDANNAADGKFAPYMGKPFVQYINTEDTIFCDKVEMWMKGQEVVEVTYTVEGEKTNLKGKDVLKLERFYAENQVLVELMPVNPDKPDGKKQHLFKNLKGYFTVWSNNHRVVLNLQSFNWGNSYQAFPTSFILVSMDGGPIFRPNRKGAFKELIKPLLKDCDGIQGTEVHVFEVNNMEFIDQVFDYNRLCAPDYN
jgi:hypothetical protein